MWCYNFCSIVTGCIFKLEALLLWPFQWEGCHLSAYDIYWPITALQNARSGFGSPTSDVVPTGLTFRLKYIIAVLKIIKTIHFIPLKTLLNRCSTKHLLIDKIIEYLEETCLSCSCFILKSWMYGWWFSGSAAAPKGNSQSTLAAYRYCDKCWDVLVLLLCDLHLDVFQMSFPEPLIGDDGLQRRSARRLVEMLMIQPERWKHRFSNILFSVLFWQVNLRNLNMYLPVK